MTSQSDLEKAIRAEHEKLKSFASMQKILSGQGVTVLNEDEEEVKRIQRKIKQEQQEHYMHELLVQYACDLKNSGASSDFIIGQVQNAINVYNLLNKSQLVLNTAILARANASQ